MKTGMFVPAVAASALALAGCASWMAAGGPSDAEIVKELKESFAPRSIARLDRLDQTELQKVCTTYARSEMPKEVREGIEKAELARIRYPADGKYLGDWKRGETIAQSGVGMQFSDNEKTVNGGNCYACHQIAKAEIAYGNIGPTLYQYGKLRGNSEPIQKYTWGKIWNSHAFNACTMMPRFGDAGILTEAQIRDLMALLLDPASPVNMD